MSVPEPSSSPSFTGDSAILSIAADRAADRLGMTDSVLAPIIGLPDSATSRTLRGGITLTPGSTAFGMAVLFVRMFTALDAITAGDESIAKVWLANRNDVLGDAPINLIQTAKGLADVVQYLDSRNTRL